MLFGRIKEREAHFPKDAPKIAGLYAGELQALHWEGPLGTFLRDLVKVEDVRAVVLSVHRESRSPLWLSMITVTTSRIGEGYEEALDLLSVMRQRTGGVTGPEVGIGFLHLEGRDLSSAIPPVIEELRKPAQNITSKPPLRAGSTITVARI
jgi:hypothetical protein